MATSLCHENYVYSGVRTHMWPETLSLICTWRPCSRASRQLGGRAAGQLGGCAAWQLDGRATEQLGGRAAWQLGGSAAWQLGGRAAGQLGGIRELACREVVDFI